MFKINVIDISPLKYYTFSRTYSDDELKDIENPEAEKVENTEKIEKEYRHNIISYNEGKNYVLEVQLAGFEKENIEVIKEEDNLIIRAIPYQELDLSSLNYLVKNFNVEYFRQKFKISKDLQIERTTFRNGVLTIEFSKIAKENIKIEID